MSGVGDIQTELENWQQYLINSMGLSKNTRDSYLSDIKMFIRFLCGYRGSEISLDDIKQLEKQDIRAWFLYMKNNCREARTMARSLSAIKSLLKYMLKEKLITDSPIINMRPPKVRKTLPRPLTISQINNILESVKELKHTDWIVRRDRALLALVYSSGLRINEALSLNRTDITSSSGFITVVGKGSKTRMVPIVAEVISALNDYIISSEPYTKSSALFVNKNGGRLSSSAVQKLMKKSREMLGLSDNTTPHALRHSCATHLMENSGDLRGIQELLGHSSISSTQIYADVAKKYISDIYDKCHPLGSKKNDEDKK